MRILRSLHRWVGIVVAVFFLLIAGSGVWLQFTPNRMDEVAPDRLSNSEIVKSFALSLQSARKEKGDARLGSVLLNVAGKQPLVVMSFQSTTRHTDLQAIPGPDPEDITLDLRSGKVVPAVGRLHRFLVEFHNSFMLGAAGRIIDSICGIGLLALSISGLWIYIDLLRRRISRGKASPFWSTTAPAQSTQKPPPRPSALTKPIYRDLHRWLNTVFAVFLLIIAVSGIMLQLSAFGILGGGPPDGGFPGKTLATQSPPDLTDAQLVQALADSLAAGERVEPNGELFMILMNSTGPATRASLTYGSYTKGMFSHNFDTRTGEAQPMPKMSGISSFFLLKLHRGDLFHTPGTVVSILSGLALLTFSISGIVIYLDMLMRRRSRGQRSLFWH